MIDRTIPPQSKEIAQIEIQEAQKIQLPNGTNLFYLSAGQLPVIRIELIYKSGAFYEQKNGQSYFSAKMLSEGSENYTAQEIAHQLDYYGSFLEISPGLDQISVVIYTLSKHLETICSLMRSVLDKPLFPEKELLVQKRIKKQSIKINQEKNSVLASHAIRKNIFGTQHPYGKSLEIEDLEAINSEDLMIYKESMLFNDPTILVSGGLSDSDISIIANTFSGLAYAKDVSKSFEDYVPTQKLEVIERPNTVQSSIRIAKKGLAKNHPDFCGFSILNEIFGGYFGSRLMKNIREDKGFTYGIYSSLLNLHHDDLMVIGADVNKENAKATTSEIFLEMRQLREKPIPEEELSMVRNYMLGNFMSSLTSPFSLSDKFKSIHFHDLGYSFYHQYIDTIKNITPDELQGLANKYLQEDSFQQVVVGGY